MIFATCIHLVVAILSLSPLVLTSPQSDQGFEGRCGYPGWPSYGYYNSTEDPYTVSYSCKNSTVYRLTGAEERRCLSSGLWDLPIPTCDLNLVHDPDMKILCTSGESSKPNCSLSKQFKSSLRFSTAVSSVRFVPRAKVAFRGFKVAVMVTDDQDGNLLNTTKAVVWKTSNNTTLDCPLTSNTIKPKLVKLTFDCTGNSGDQLEVVFDASYVQMFTTEIYGHKGEFTCGVPDVLLNAQYYHEKENLVRYRCNPGYVLANAANSSLECRGRIWNGTVTPSCLKKPERVMSYSASQVANFVLAAIVCLIFALIFVGLIIRCRRRSNVCRLY